MIRLSTYLVFAAACLQACAFPRTSIEEPRSRSSLQTPFRTIRNAVVERIWSIPARRPSAHSHGSSRTRYSEDIVLRFTIGTIEEADAFQDAAHTLYLDIWESTNEWVDIRVQKDVVPAFLQLLPPTLQNAYIPAIYDLADAVQNTYPDATNKRSWSSPAEPELEIRNDLFFHNYQPLSVIYPWMRLMTSLFPSSTELIDIGDSAEGRSIPALRITAPVQQEQEDTPRQTILVSGGTHAREWISTSTTLFIAHTFMTRWHDPTINDILKHFDIVFIPTLNPDGYDYTWTTDRLWRKTRQPTSLPFCHGIDLDRAFGFGWDGDQGADNPCSETFAGGSPLAAVEARALVEWAKNETDANNVKFVAFVDLHSYSQQVLYPYSYSCEEKPHNLEDLQEVGFGLAKSFRLSSGHQYRVSSACQSSIVASKKKGNHQDTQVTGQGGSAIDFFHHDLGVKYAYQIKLRDQGSYGFLLPRSDIVPSGREATEAVLGLGRYLLSNHGIERD